MQRKGKKGGTAAWEKGGTLVSSAVAPVETPAQNESANHHCHPPVWYLDLLFYDSPFNAVAPRKWVPSLTRGRSFPALSLHCTTFRRVYITNNQ